MPTHLCVCKHIRCLATETQVLVVIHPAENNKPSNSGHLCRELLTNAEVRVASSAGVVEPPIALEPGRKTVLLFPDENAPELCPTYDTPVTLVVPDAPWRQARRMALKWRALSGLPRVRLPSGRPGRFRLRKAPGGAHALGTLEAVARALGILECQWVEDEMTALHERVVLRGLYARGRERADDELRRDLAEYRAVNGHPL